MIDFPTLSYTLTCEFSTLDICLSLRKVQLRLHEIYATCVFRDFACAHISRHLNFAILRKFYILDHFHFAFLSTTVYNFIGNVI